MTTNIDDAAEIIGRHVHPDFAEDAARDLAAEGHLTPAPTIIHTVEELRELDHDTVVLNSSGDARTVGETITQYRYRTIHYAVLPAVVVAAAEQVRAARKALEEA